MAVLRLHRASLYCYGPIDREMLDEDLSGRFFLPRLTFAHLARYAAAILRRSEESRGSVEVVEALRKYLAAHRARCGNPAPHRPIFATALGTPLSPNNLLNRTIFARFEPLQEVREGGRRSRDRGPYVRVRKFAPRVARMARFLGARFQHASTK